MRVVFFGSPNYAVHTLRALLDAPDIEVVAAVTQPDRPRGRRGAPEATAAKALAVEAGIEAILQPERVRRDTTERLLALRPDVGVVAAPGHILPNHLLEAFPHDVLNVHAALLPRHRGASPVAAAILAGDAESGATIMRVVREIDAGPVAGVVRTAIEPLDSAGTLMERIGLEERMECVATEREPGNGSVVILFVPKAPGHSRGLPGALPMARAEKG